MAEQEKQTEEVVDEIKEEVNETVEDENLKNAAEEAGKEPQAEEAGETKAAADTEKKKPFSKKEKKKDKKDEMIEELTDRVKRQMAEFENFRKRTDKEKSSMYEMGAKAVIEKILPVIDNFERGLSSISEEEKK